MYFLNFPPLWFLRGSPPVVTSVDVCVSVTYQASIGVDVLDSVDIDLSALVFGLSTTFIGSAHGIQAGIDLDDNTYSSLDLRASITPVYQLSQSGETQACVSSNYQISVSVTASLGINATPSVTYQLSASLSASILISDNICVSVDYRLSIAPLVLVDVQGDPDNPSITAAYGVSTSINPQVAIINRGGLVYSRKKQRYMAVRIGPYAQDTT